MAAADQRNLTATVSIADIAAKVEKDHQESVMKLAQAHDVSAKTVHATLHKICCSQEVSQLSNQTALRGDEEGAIQNVLHGFLTMMDNVLSIGGSAGGKKQAAQPQPQSGGPEGAAGGAKNSIAANFAKAL